MKGNPQRDCGQLVGILRKIPEEGLSAAARGILFPELKVRTSKPVREQERKLRLREKRKSGGRSESRLDG